MHLLCKRPCRQSVFAIIATQKADFMFPTLRLQRNCCIWKLFRSRSLHDSPPDRVLRTQTLRSSNVEPFLLPYLLRAPAAFLPGLFQCARACRASVREIAETPNPAKLIRPVPRVQAAQELLRFRMVTARKDKPMRDDPRWASRRAPTTFEFQLLLAPHPGVAREHDARSRLDDPADNRAYRQRLLHSRQLQIYARWPAYPTR